MEVVFVVMSLNIEDDMSVPVGVCVSDAGAKRLKFSLDQADTQGSYRYTIHKKPILP